MGYYVAIPCRHASVRDAMLRFLDEHFRPASAFMDWVDQDNRMPNPTHGKQVCTYAKANEIGWYRNAGWDDEHRHYSRCFLRWASMKVGRTLTLSEGQVPGLGEEEVHYTIYEGNKMPFVLLTEHPDVPTGWDAEGYEACDDLGWNRSMSGPNPGEDPGWDAQCSPWLLKLRKRKAKADPLIRAELERLDKLWEAR